MKTLDMRGEPCPIPVVNAKKALFESGITDAGGTGIVVLVDNIAAVQNLEKMAKGTGCGFSYLENGASQYTVTITKGAGAGIEKGAAAEGPSAETPSRLAAGSKGALTVLITADSMGRGAEDLGRLLIKGFIFSLTQLNPPPSALIFLNSGAHLTTAGANTVPDLKTLEGKGTGVYTCGTCANYYKLTEKLAVGSIVDMMAITNLLSRAQNVITI
jgi:selenium metabolism protein YedF